MANGFSVLKRATQREQNDYKIVLQPFWLYKNIKYNKEVVLPQGAPSMPWRLLY